MKALYNYPSLKDGETNVMADTPTLLKYVCSTKAVDASLYSRDKSAVQRRKTIEKTLDYIEFSISPLCMRLQKLAF